MNGRGCCSASTRMGSQQRAGVLVGRRLGRDRDDVDVAGAVVPVVERERADDVQPLDQAGRARIDDIEIGAQRGGDVHRISLVRPSQQQPAVDYGAAA